METIKYVDTKCCRMVRTDEGKKLRKAYENHEIHHGFNEHRELELREDKLVNSITTVQKDNLIFEQECSCRIRKLTPRECWRLMGYTDEDYDKAEKVCSNSQLYKQAGNAIVKQVLMAIFTQMIPEKARDKRL